MREKVASWWLLVAGHDHVACVTLAVSVEVKWRVRDFTLE